VAKRPYSTKHTARQNPRRYLLSGIPPTLWARAQAKAKREGVAMRTLILTLLQDWLKPSIADGTAWEAPETVPAVPHTALDVQATIGGKATTAVLKP
jgi:hypothetical protein